MSNWTIFKHSIVCTLKMNSSIYSFSLNNYFRFNQVFSVLPYRKWEKNSKKPFLIAVKNAAMMLLMVLLFIYVTVDNNLNCDSNMNSVSVQIFHLGNVLSLLLCLSYLKHLDINSDNLVRLVDLVDQVKRNYHLHTKWITASMSHFVFLHIAVGFFFSSNNKIKNDNSLDRVILYSIQTVGFYYEYLGANTLLLLNLVIIDKLLQINAIIKQLNHRQTIALNSIKNAKRLYISIVGITTSLNEYFGLKILLTFGNALCRVLWLLFVLIQNSNDKSIRFDWSTLGTTFIHIFVGMVRKNVLYFVYKTIPGF